MLEIPINEAKGRLSGLIRAASEGERVVLTSHGKPVAEITPIQKRSSATEKRQAIKAAQGRYTSKNPLPAAQAGDVLYAGQTGLPE
jgi:prevent-host-death family protein